MNIKLFYGDRTTFGVNGYGLSIKNNIPQGNIGSRGMNDSDQIKKDNYKRDIVEPKGRYLWQ